jgi:hypothetical protein
VEADTCRRRGVVAMMVSSSSSHSSTEMTWKQPKVSWTAEEHSLR